MLIIGGVITCSMAQNAAEADGYALFHTTEDGGTKRTQDFSDRAITKIDLVVSDAEIRIIGGGEKSYIEILNFQDGMYTFSSAGKIITLDEIVDIKSLFDLSNGFSFSGIRYFLNPNKPSGTRQVNIYLNSLAMENLKIVSVKGANCSLEIDTLSADCDITVTAEQSLTLSTAQLQASTLTVDAPTAILEINYTALNTLMFDAEHCDITAEKFSFKTLDIEAADGEVSITSPIALTDYNIDIGSGNGRANIGGFDRPRPYKATAETVPPVGTIKFTSVNANFSLKEIPPAPQP